MMYAAASGFLPFLSFLSLVEARSFWSSSPATHAVRDSDDYILKTGYPLGNGRLGAIPFGPPGAETIALNIDSLWSGGPFESSSYRGGNPTEPKYQALPDIREAIWRDGTGNVDALLGSGANYGSYRVMANLTISIDHGEASYRNYRRTLDLEQGTYQTAYQVGKRGYTTNVFCSYPSHVCVYRISSDSALPAVTVNYENQLIDSGLVTASCNSQQARFTGYTQAGPPQGMKFDSIARISGGRFKTDCSKAGVLTISPTAGQTSLTLVIGAGTNFDQTKGNAENKYSFKGQDPAVQVEAVTAAAAGQSYESLASKHAADYKSLFGAFSLNLPDTKGSADRETADIISSYTVDGTGDPFVESLLFDLGRYMLITSSREDSLPSNLQGRWAEELYPAWSADYHANINTQMNYWMADQTGLSRTQVALWNYMQYNWVPRGSETANLLYGAKGWVVHNEMNIFGHTGMKDSATWANYPAAAAWMMQHVWDNFEYTQDINWLRSQGYPLLKGVAQFWLSQLQKDAFSKDGTLVVNPCNSPEHGPTTFGCTHDQQVIYQVFEATLAASSLVGERDKNFVKDVSNKLAILDHGVHISNWGGIKEWKIPDSYGHDGPNTHRHLSHLVGWHPGYSMASFDGGYTNATIQAAVSKTLESRGKGTANDADAGWEKVWRSACWARLNNTKEAYDELRYAIDTNFAGNGFSMFEGQSAPFQIEANFGLGGAMLSMLVVDLPVPHTVDQRKPRTVVLGPAIPAIWGGGSVKGLRLRGGRSVDFSWGDDGKVNRATLRGSGKPVILVNVDGEVLAK